MRLPVSLLVASFLALAVPPSLAAAAGRDAIVDPDEEAPAELRGVAYPDDERWGDEWYEEENESAARALEQEMLESATRPAEQPPEAEPPAVAKRPKRQLLLPRHGPDALEEGWRRRLEAFARGDAAAAAEATERLFALLGELDVREHRTLAAAAARQSGQLQDDDPRAAVDSAALAVRLAPSFPSAWLQLSRARFGANPFDASGIVEALVGGLRAASSDPRSIRNAATVGGLAAAIALLGTLAAVLLVGCLRHARSLLHDLRHLLPLSISRLQTAAAALLLLALPSLLGFGPLVTAALIGAALWIYLETQERIVLAALLVAAAFVPRVAGVGAEALRWDGTAAATLHAIEHEGDLASLDRLGAAATRDGPPELLFVAARAEKRLGRLERAQALYERALAARPGWPEAQVNLGNVRWLRGDVPGAERRYRLAMEADPELAEAYFNLSRVHYERADLDEGGRARARAIALDPRLVERYDADEEEQALANRFLVDATLAPAQLDSLARGGDESARIEDQLRVLLFGSLWASAPAWALASAVLLLLLARWGLRGARPARPCSRCGRAVCGQCDPETAGGTLCGQCVNVFARRALVDADAKAAKERAVARWEKRRAFVRRVAALALGAPLLAGRTLGGSARIALAIFLLALAILPGAFVRVPHDGWPDGLRLALLLPPLAVLALFAFREARGGG